MVSAISKLNEKTALYFAKGYLHRHRGKDKAYTIVVYYMGEFKVRKRKNCYEQFSQR